MFQKENFKAYRSHFEEKHRFKLFQKRVKEIEEHNARYRKGLETFKKGVNQFTDLTEEEFSKLHSIQIGPRTLQSRLPDEIFNDDPFMVSAKSIDWRLKGAIGPVGTQGDCGSCYAFSSVSSIYHVLIHLCLNCQRIRID